MSFKRTSEGRVFFQGSKTANDWPVVPKKDASKKEKQETSEDQASNFQIVSLLRALNEKLQATQAERREMRQEIESYRALLEDMQKKSAENKKTTQISHAEDLAQEALKELEETRKLMLQIEDKAERADKGLSSLKNQLIKTVQLQERFEQKQSDFEQKIQESSATQAKMLRQVDKASEERARFMRKIERIEEAVLQTQDALNNKGLAFLSEQQDALPPIHSLAQDPEALLIPKKEQAEETVSDQAWWKRPLEMNSGTMALVLLVTVFAGWGLSKVQKPSPVKLSGINIEASVQPDSEEKTAFLEKTPDKPESFSTLPTEQETEKTSQSIVENTGAIPTVSETSDVENDIGVIDINDEAQILNVLEKDPESLAKKLNDLEPSTDVASKTEIKDPVRLVEEDVKETSSAFMKPDVSLPASLKDIQEKAFKGVPEAQHDLGAIYTAGHGGVKQDYNRAAFWFGEASKKNIPNAMYNLGVLYHQGLGVEKSIDKAIDMYKNAAELNHAEAQYNLGIAYIEGLGVPYNPQIATRNFQSAAAKGIMEAAYNLGLIYENGLLGKAAPDEALMWYKVAADRGSNEAKRALEQLAKTLNISPQEVNRIADDMKASKKEQPENDQPILTAQIQEYLKKTGFYNGKADGTLTQDTEKAIRLYQEKNGLTPDGKISKELLARMLVTNE